MCEAPFHTQVRTPPPPSPAEPSEHPWVKVPSNGPRGRNNAVSEAQAQNVNGPGEWRPHVRAWRGCGNRRRSEQMRAGRSQDGLCSATHSGWHGGRGAPSSPARSRPTGCALLAAAQESCSCDVPKRNPASPTGGRVRRGPRALRSAVTTRPPRQLAWPLRVPGAGSPPAPPGRAERLQVLLPHLRRASPARGTCPSEPGVRGCTNPHALSRGTAHLRGEARLRFSMLRSPLPNAP